MKTPRLAENFATNLRLLRKHYRLTQPRLAKSVGMATSYISLLENGKRTPPLQTVEALAMVLRVPPLWLLVSRTSVGVING